MKFSSTHAPTGRCVQPVLGALLVAGCVAPLANDVVTTPGETGPQASFRVDAGPIDLGTLFVGQKSSTVVAFANLTASSLECTVEVSCGCQDLMVDGVAVARSGGRFCFSTEPGEHQLTFDVTPPTAGNKGVYARFSAGARMQLVSFAMKALDELRVDPVFVDLGTVKQGEPLPFSARITSHDGMPFRLQTEFVAADLRDVVVAAESDHQFVVRGHAVPTQRGRGSGDVRMRTDRQYSDWVYVVVTWQVPHAVEVEPELLQFGPVRASDGKQTRELIVTTGVDAPEPTIVLDVEPPGALSIEGEPTIQVLGDRRIRHYRLAVATGTTGSPAGRLAGHVVIGDATGELRRIRVMGTLVSSR